MRCPEPYPDCRPGACACDMVYDRANYHAPNANATKVQEAFFRYLRGLKIIPCETCGGEGRSITEAFPWDEEKEWAAASPKASKRTEES